MARGVGYLRVVLLGLGAACASLLLWHALAAPADELPTVEPALDANPQVEAPRAAVPFSALDLTGTSLPAAALLAEHGDGTRTYLSYVGPVRVTAAFADHGNDEGYKSLAEALAMVISEDRALPSDSAPWRWIPFGIFGGGLLDPKGACLLMGHETLLPVDVPSRDVDAERRAVRTAARAFLAAAEADPGTSSWVAGALGDALKLLHAEPSDPSAADLDPCFARRVVAQEGWLATVAPRVDAALRDALLRVLRASLELTPTARHSDGGNTVTHIGNAWGAQGLHIDLFGLSLLLTPPPQPMHSRSRMRTLRQCSLLYRLPDHSDPVTNPAVVADCQLAGLLWAGELIAVWTKDDNDFAYDLDRWRDAFPYYRRPAVTHAWPAHIPLRGPDGVFHGLLTPSGLLKPVNEANEEEYERFLEDAARMLDSPAYIDLLQQYFVRYVYDSPDVKCPLMLGSATHSADIHQTARQTLSTCVGGICRGDCDDFAELLQRILRRQGHLAYIAGVRGHVATLWATKHEHVEATEKREAVPAHWRVYVFQSGPSREYRDVELGSALRQAFKVLSPHEPFDDQGVKIMLRFAGGNTRGRYGLPARIFHDQPYAAALIGVQRDWHRSTLFGAERKMVALVEAGDTSIGTYRELAAVYASMGRHAEAARYDRMVLAAQKEPENLLIRRVELIHNLVEAGSVEAMRKEVRHVLDEQLPEIGPTLGLRVLTPALDMAGHILDADPALAWETLRAVLEQHVDAFGGSLAGLLDPSRDPKMWREHKRNKALQRFARDLAWAVRYHLREHGVPEGVPGEPVLRPVDTWLRRHALDHAEDPDDHNVLWALRALRLEAELPGFHARVLAAEPPEAAASSDALEGEAYIASVVRWARASSWYFCTLLIGAAWDGEDQPDLAQLALLEKAMVFADGAGAKLGLQGPQGADRMQRARLYLVLARRDAKGLRGILEALAAEDDRRDIRSAAFVLAGAARHADLAWWKTILATWDACFDSDHHRFRFAWMAKHYNKDALARYAAEHAARRFPEDEALQAEARAFIASD